MKIPPYWLKEQREIAGRVLRLYGSSFLSMEEARQALEQRARLWADYLASPHADASRFSVFTQSLRAIAALPGEAEYCVSLTEPIERSVDAFNVLTRNRYGVLVLNSTDHAFVDVDDFRGSAILRFLGLSKKPESLLMEAVQKLCLRDDRLSARVYHTAHGWRVLLRGPGVELGSARMAELFSALQADPLYVSLCRKQKCWRARLSPKPFHLGLPRFPQLTDSEQAAHQMAPWLERYAAVTAPFAVCRLLDSFGPSFHSTVMELHDAYTRALCPDRPLA
ncbi:MAG: hypothetical protein IJA63_05850 [Akkermansia sp.]|nr:hypothetical protein [Akkermansia sp.]